MVTDHTRLYLRAYLGIVSTSESTERFVDIGASPRSTGSILNPLLYGLLLQEGSLLPTTFLPHIPTLFGTYAPQTYDQHDSGAIPTAQVIAQSLNVTAVNVQRT